MCVCLCVCMIVRPQTGCHCMPVFMCVYIHFSGSAPCAYTTQINEFLRELDKHVDVHLSIYCQDIVFPFLVFLSVPCLCMCVGGRGASFSRQTNQHPWLFYTPESQLLQFINPKLCTSVFPRSSVHFSGTRATANFERRLAL